MSSGLATVSVGGEEVTATVVRGLTLAVNDPVLVSRVGSLFIVVDRLGTSAPTPPQITPTPPPVTSGRLVVAPVFTGSFRSGGWRTHE